METSQDKKKRNQKNQNQNISANKNSDKSKRFFTVRDHPLPHKPINLALNY